MKMQCELLTGELDDPNTAASTIGKKHGGRYRCTEGWCIEVWAEGRLFAPPSKTSRGNSTGLLYIFLRKLSELGVWARNPSQTRIPASWKLGFCCTTLEIGRRIPFAS